MNNYGVVILSGLQSILSTHKITPDDGFLQEIECCFKRDELLELSDELQAELEVSASPPKLPKDSGQ